MKRTFNLSKDEVYQLLLNAIEHSFAPEKVKQELKKKLDFRILGYYYNL